MNDQVNAHVSAVFSMDNDEARRTLPVQHSTGYDSYVNVDNNVPSYINDLIHKRYSVWCQCWSTVVQPRGLHYSPPGGSVGRQHVEQLGDKLTYLFNGTYPSERLLVFSAVILQQDRFVCRGTDIRCLVMWKNDAVDALIREAERCNKSLCNSTRIKSRHIDYFVKVFTKLMLQGNI